MFDMVVTLLVSHVFTVLLNAELDQNIEDISVTLLVSHEPSGSLNVDTDSPISSG